jgi:hypothetical protein
MRSKQHFGQVRMPVPGMACTPYITRSEKRTARKDKKLSEFLLAYSKPSRAQRKHYELLTGRKARKPLTKKEREAWAKKAFAQIKGRGLGELEMFTICDLFEEWWEGQWKYVMEGGQWVAKRQKKGERHRRAGKNWKKALPVINENREEKKRTEPDRFIKSFGSSSYSQARRKS